MSNEMLRTLGPGKRLLLGIMHGGLRTVPATTGPFKARTYCLENLYRVPTFPPDTDRVDFEQLKAAREQTDSLDFRCAVPPSARSLVYISQSDFRKSLFKYMGVDLEGILREADKQSPHSEGIGWVEKSLFLFLNTIDHRNPIHAGLIHGFEDYLGDLKMSPENLVYPLLGPATGSGSQISVRRETTREVLRLLLEMPHPECERGLLRMPVRLRYRDADITDAGGATVARFDPLGRLSEAPSLKAPLQVDAPQDWTDAAGIRIRVQDALVIGAGPGGISTSFELMCRGVFDQVVLEGGDRPLSAILEQYPAGKPVEKVYKRINQSPEGVIAIDDSTDVLFYRRMESFVNFGHLNIRTGERVVEIRRADPVYLVRTEAGNVFASRNLVMAAGRLHKPNRVSGYLELQPNVQEQISVASAKAVARLSGKKVLVLGGGQTAYNMVTALLQKGNRVVLSYRQSKFNRLSEEQEKDLLTLEKKGLVTILRETLFRTAVLAEDREHSLHVSFDKAVKAGRVGPEALDSAPPNLDVDHVITALGFEFDDQLLQIPGYEGLQVKNERVIDAKGIVLPGCYVIGDFVKSAAVMPAINGGVRAAKSIAGSFMAPAV